MKTLLCSVLLAVGLGGVHAQDAAIVISSDGSQPIDYQPPVIYTAPVVYNAPVVYEAPVTYVTVVNATDPYAYQPACYAPCEAPSTVTYIGGGQVSYSVSPCCNVGSTVTVIGHSRFR